MKIETRRLAIVPGRGNMQNTAISACPTCDNNKIYNRTGKCAGYHGRYTELVS